MVLFKRHGHAPIFLKPPSYVLLLVYVEIHSKNSQEHLFFDFVNELPNPIPLDEERKQQDGSR